MNRHLPDVAATQKLAEALLAALPADTAGWTILLQGELGAGKSTLARALLAALGHDGPVPSPTYTLVEPYNVAGHVIYHIDLYRVSDEEELRYLGWNDLTDGMRLIEWPERVPGLQMGADLLVTLSYAGAARDVRIEALSDRAEPILEVLAADS